ATRLQACRVQQDLRLSGQPNRSRKRSQTETRSGRQRPEYRRGLRAIFSVRRKMWSDIAKAPERAWRAPHSTVVQDRRSALVTAYRAYPSPQANFQARQSAFSTLRFAD